MSIVLAVSILYILLLFVSRETATLLRGWPAGRGGAEENALGEIELLLDGEERFFAELPIGDEILLVVLAEDQSGLHHLDPLCQLFLLSSQLSLFGEFGLQTSNVFQKLRLGFLHLVHLTFP